MYNVVNAGGEVLNLDGPIELLEDAIRLAGEIEGEHDIYVRTVEVNKPGETTMANNLVAAWDESRAAYRQEDLSIWSMDGDEWRDNHGSLFDSEEFKTATILLVGGPRDGDTVS